MRSLVKGVEQAGWASGSHHAASAYCACKFTSRQRPLAAKR
jgi:hypothetical protein